MDKAFIKVGQRVKIENNSILGYMGLKVATGTVQSLHANGGGINFKCDQTGAIEGADFDDGTITAQ